MNFLKRILPRRVFLLAVAVALGLSCKVDAAAEEKIPRVAIIATVWHPISHADVIAARLMEGYNLNGEGEFPKMKAASIFTDQVHKNDRSRKLAEQYKIPIHETVAGALTLGGDTLAVDGVLLIAEHGDYPQNSTGNVAYPKRRLFGEIVQVFEKSGRVVPVFNDKHLADNWQDIEWFWKTAQQHKIPLMAGSSVPGTWRIPAIDLARDKAVKEIVVTSYHTLDAYGFHGLEVLQSLVERRKGGETGVTRVRCLEGDAVWQAMDRGEFSAALLSAAVATFKDHPLEAGKTVRDKARQPILLQIEYRDGLRASMVSADGFGEWAAAWTYVDGGTDATLFRLQDIHPFGHFGLLLRGIEQMMHTGKPTWPAERTLLTSGVLDALLISRRDGGKYLDTPYLDVRYKGDWNWQDPPPMPPVTPRPAG